MTVIDHTNIYKKYKGQWVILDESRVKVLASGMTLKQTIANFRKQYGDREIPSTYKVPTRLLPYVGTV